MVGTLIDTSKAWKSAMEKGDPVKEPLRVLMFKTIMATFVSRMNELSRLKAGDPMYDCCLSESQLFFEQAWNPVQACLIPVSGGRTMSVMDVMRVLEEMSTHAHAEALERVKVFRPLQALSATTSLPVLIVLNPVNHAGMKLWELLHRLENLSCWALIDSNMRRDRGKQSNLAKEIMKQVYPQRAP